MEFRKVTAIINRSALEKVEAALQAAGVPGISVTRVKGFGEYADFFQSDWTSTHARIEVFTSIQYADSIARTIMEAAYTGLEGDGLIAILPVEKLYRIRTRSLMDPELVC